MHCGVPTLALVGTQTHNEYSMFSFGLIKVMLSIQNTIHILIINLTIKCIFIGNTSLCEISGILKVNSIPSTYVSTGEVFLLGFSINSYFIFYDKQ